MYIFKPKPFPTDLKVVADVLLNPTVVLADVDLKNTAFKWVILEKFDRNAPYGSVWYVARQVTFLWFFRFWYYDISCYSDTFPFLPKKHILLNDAREQLEDQLNWENKQQEIKEKKSFEKRIISPTFGRN